MTRQDLANHIARLETSISEMSIEDELKRMAALDKARAEYGDEDEMLRTAINCKAREIAQAQRDGEYDYADEYEVDVA